MILTALLVLAASAQTRPVVTLEGGVSRVVIDKRGGSIVIFEFKDQKLNPLKWNSDQPGTQPRSMAHFLCLDRWGQPSAAEEKEGMPYHGEATTVEWDVSESAGSAVRMGAHLPMANLDVVRRARVHPSQALFTVSETVTNKNKLGRPFNMVQHPTIGPPFLDASVVVDSNARAGFMQSSPMPNPEQPTVFWPQALKDGQPVNLRHLTNDPDPNVVSYAVEEENGWVTAVNAAKGLLIGYTWKTKEYPWLSIWRHVDANGKPLARGLEFGTTGLHQPFQVLVQKGRIFGRPLFAWLEPAESQTRSYTAFLFKVPNDYKGVAQVLVTQDKITVKERGTGRPRDLTMDTTGLNP